MVQDCEKTPQRSLGETTLDRIDSDRLNFCRSAPKASPKIRNSFAVCPDQSDILLCSKCVFPTKNKTLQVSRNPPSCLGISYPQAETENTPKKKGRGKGGKAGETNRSTADVIDLATGLDFNFRTTVQFMVSNDVFDLPNVFILRVLKRTLFVVLDGISFKGLL